MAEVAEKDLHEVSKVLPRYKYGLSLEPGDIVKFYSHGPHANGPELKAWMLVTDVVKIKVGNKIELILVPFDRSEEKIITITMNSLSIWRYKV